MPSIDMKTVVLGPEYDERIRDALRTVFRGLGARVTNEERGTAGSQDLEIVEVEIEGRRLVVEDETYVGLSLTGPSELVDKVTAMIAERRSRE